MIELPSGMIEGGRKNYTVVRPGTIAKVQGYLDGDPRHRTFLMENADRVNAVAVRLDQRDHS